jgi:hypothetical protein
MRAHTLLGGLVAAALLVSPTAAMADESVTAAPPQATAISVTPKSQEVGQGIAPQTLVSNLTWSRFSATGGSLNNSKVTIQIDKNNPVSVKIWADGHAKYQFARPLAVGKHTVKITFVPGNTTLKSSSTTAKIKVVKVSKAKKAKLNTGYCKAVRALVYLGSPGDLGDVATKSYYKKLINAYGKVIAKDSSKAGKKAWKSLRSDARRLSSGKNLTTVSVGPVVYAGIETMRCLA